MAIIETTTLTHAQKETLCRLWNQVYPEQLQYPTLADFECYLNKLTEQLHFLLLNDKGQLQGWAFSFVRENEKWFAILLDASIQGQGQGSLLLNYLKQKEHTLNGWVVDHNNYRKQNGEPYQSPLPFYKKNDFSICPDIRLEVDQLSAVKITWKNSNALHTK